MTDETTEIETIRVINRTGLVIRGEDQESYDEFEVECPGHKPFEVSHRAQAEGRVAELILENPSRRVQWIETEISYKQGAHFSRVMPGARSTIIS